MKKTLLALVSLGVIAVLVLVFLKKRGTGQGVTLSVPSLFRETRPVAPVPGRAVSPVPQARVSVTAADREKANVLDQILKSRNDNDPRLDTDLRTLSEGAKELFREKYSAFKPEKLNEKGTIVFLLGRNMTSAQDFAFMEDVLNEPPCLSLGDCSRESTAVGGDDVGADEVTAAYPQMVALNSLENYISGSGAGKDAKLSALDLAILKNAMNSRVSIVARKASQLYSRFSNHH